MKGSCGEKWKEQQGRYSLVCVAQNYNINTSVLPTPPTAE